MRPESSADPIHESGCVGDRRLAGRAVAVVASAAVVFALLFGLVLFGDPGVTPAMAATQDPTPSSVTSPPSTAAPTTIVEPPTTVTEPSVTTSPDATDVPVSDPTVPVTNNDNGEQPRDTRDSSQGTGANVQDTAPPTTAPLTTTENLLVGAPPSTVTTTTIKSLDLTTSKVASRNAGSDPKIWAITAAMTLAALVLAVATVLYWRRTKPTDDLDTGTGGVGKGGSRRSGRSRYSDLVITVPKTP